MDVVMKESEKHLLHPLQQLPFHSATLCFCSPSYQQQLLLLSRLLLHTLGVHWCEPLHSMVLAHRWVVEAAQVPRDIEHVAERTDRLPTHERHGDGIGCVAVGVDT